MTCLSECTFKEILIAPSTGDCYFIFIVSSFKIKFLNYFLKSPRYRLYWSSSTANTAFSLQCYRSIIILLIISIETLNTKTTTTTKTASRIQNKTRKVYEYVQLGMTLSIKDRKISVVNTVKPAHYAQAKPRRKVAVRSS